jgi:hypothetical protein
MALQFRGQARSGLGDLGGLDDLREALRTGRNFGLGHETARAHVNLASVIWLTEGPAEALEIQRAGIEFGERRGLTNVVLRTKGASLWTLFDLGEWDELLHVADELLSWDRLGGGSYFGGDRAQLQGAGPSPPGAAEGSRVAERGVPSPGT